MARIAGRLQDPWFDPFRVKVLGTERPLASGLDKDGKPKEGKVVETETHLNVADLTGKSTKTILSAKGRAGPAITLNKLEWR